ncbi:AAA family ATPase [Mesorhizobium sp. KR1-2]|uniref:AAA family ATPase n=1 Tax=Mesorhizobium sp. KR1-2 TaxID=3156609 RepID=UPI0032B49E68
MTDETSRDYRLFKRREKAVAAGLRLPTEEELLPGMPFFRNDLTQDLREYGDRLARRLRRRQRPDLASVVACLEEVAVEQSRDSLLVLEAAMDGLGDAVGVPLDAARLRCLLYRAGFGDPDAAAGIAGEMALLALRDLQSSDNLRMLWCALGWAAFSRDLAAWRRAGVFGSPAKGLGVGLELRSYADRFKTAMQRQRPAGTEAKAAPSENSPGLETAVQPASGDRQRDGHVIVLREVGNPAVSQGKDVSQEFQKITGRPLPVPATPDLAAVRANLVAEFPYAIAVIDQVLKGLMGRRHVRMRPTILLGSPGCGKSRFARRLAEELGAPHELIPCGGMSDGALGGTPRRWSSGEPSLPILIVRRHECAGPVIILDEIEKVGTSRHNGNVHDVLVGLFEQETSSRWHDPYVQASCDLSHLTWLMTANAIEPIPAVLRDRCRLLRFPEPGPEHLPMLALRIMARLYAELGHDPRWATPLEGFELAAIAAAWRGGSIRRLERMLEQLVAVRERERSLQ